MNTDKVTVRIVRERADLERAWRIRHNAYVRAEHIAPTPSGMYRDAWDDSAIVTQFLAEKEGIAVGAVRLVLDSARGLPMETIFPQEVRNLREQGGRLAEASGMSVDDNRRGTYPRVYCRLGTALMDHVRVLGIDTLCVAVHEDDFNLYHDRLKFEEMGSPYEYPSFHCLAYPFYLRANSDEHTAALWKFLRRYAGKDGTANS
jgi:hypothetical protein